MLAGGGWLAAGALEAGGIACPPCESAEAAVAHGASCVRMSRNAASSWSITARIWAGLLDCRADSNRLIEAPMI